MNLRDALDGLPQPDEDAIAAVHARAADILRPPGALQWLDDLAAWVAGWQRNPLPRVERPVGVVFAADHGVATAAKVSALEPKVTAAMFAACVEGRSTIRSFARHAGATVTAIDVGIGKPTGDIRFEAAMSPERFSEIVDVAWSVVDGVDGDLLVLGEMGIGNTTVSAAVAAALAGGETAAWVGRGTGIDDATLSVKRAAVQQAVRRIAGVTDPLDVLREVGGSELVAIAAAVVAARHRSLPVVLDGYVVTASVLPLVLLAPTILDHCTVGHCSAEPGHRQAARPPGQAPVARPRHAPRRGQRSDGRRAADRHGLRRHHRSPHDHRVVRSTLIGVFVADGVFVAGRVGAWHSNGSKHSNGRASWRRGRRDA